MNTSLLVTYYAMISPGLEYTVIFCHVLLFEIEGGNEGRGSMDNKGGKSFNQSEASNTIAK